MSRLCCSALPGWIWAWPPRQMKPRSCASATCLNSTICAARMLDTVNRYLETKGIRISTGTIVDATIIHAPSSTKNSSGKRDPEMHQVKKGNQWYFGAKAHIGVDSKETVVHSVATSAGQRGGQNICCPTYCMARSARYGVMAAIRVKTEAIHEAAPKAQDMTCRRTKYKDYVDEESQAQETQPRPESGPRWSIRFVS